MYKAVTFSYLSAHVVTVLALVGIEGCASDKPTDRFSQQDANRVVSLCSGGMAQSLVAKLEASYLKDANAKIEASAGQEARGIIFTDTTLSGVSSADRVQLTDKYQSCIKEMEAKR